MCLVKTNSYHHMFWFLRQNLFPRDDGVAESLDGFVESMMAANDLTQTRFDGNAVNLHVDRVDCVVGVGGTHLQRAKCRLKLGLGAIQVLRVELDLAQSAVHSEQ